MNSSMYGQFQISHCQPPSPSTKKNKPKLQSKVLLQLFRKAAFYFLFSFHIFSDDLFSLNGFGDSGSPARRPQQALIALLPAASVDRAWPMQLGMGREGNSSFYTMGTHGETFHFFRGYNLPIYWGLKKTFIFPCFYWFGHTLAFHGEIIFCAGGLRTTFSGVCTRSD